jgi:hypothetical protein
VFDEPEDLELTESTLGVESVLKCAFDLLDSDVLILFALGVLVLSLDHAPVRSGTDWKWGEGGGTSTYFLRCVVVLEVEDVLLQLVLLDLLGLVPVLGVKLDDLLRHFVFLLHCGNNKDLIKKIFPKSKGPEELGMGERDSNCFQDRSILLRPFFEIYLCALTRADRGWALITR